MEQLFEAWCRDNRDLSFGEYLDQLYRSWDANAPTPDFGDDVVALYGECHRRIRAEEEVAVAFLGVDHFWEMWNQRLGQAERVFATLNDVVATVFTTRVPDGLVAAPGGSNYLLLFNPSDITTVCSAICTEFDRRVKSENPAPTLSIGVVSNTRRPSMLHFWQFFWLAKEMRAYAETQSGSLFVVDNRDETILQ